MNMDGFRRPSRRGSGRVRFDGGRRAGAPLQFVVCMREDRRWRAGGTERESAASRAAMGSARESLRARLYNQPLRGRRSFPLLRDIIFYLFIYSYRNIYLQISHKARTYASGRSHVSGGGVRQSKTGWRGARCSRRHAGGSPCQ